MIVAVIVGCEIGFWVVLAAGLLARYGLGRRRLGAVLLACVPVVDLVLLAVTVIDLRGGAVATAAHGLAAVYLGFSVVFGHRTVAALDARVAYHFAGGPAPVAPPRSGPPAIRYAWVQWGRAAAAWAVSGALLVAAILLVGAPARTAELVATAFWLTVGLGVWLIAGPLLAHARRALSGRSTTAAAASPPPKPSTASPSAGRATRRR